MKFKRWTLAVAATYIVSCAGMPATVRAGNLKVYHTKASSRIGEEPPGTGMNAWDLLDANDQLTLTLNKDEFIWLAFKNTFEDKKLKWVRIQLDGVTKTDDMSLEQVMGYKTADTSDGKKGSLKRSKMKNGKWQILYRFKPVPNGSDSSSRRKRILRMSPSPSNPGASVLR